MPHRIDVTRENGSMSFEVQGLLDLPALAELRAALAVAVETGLRARVVLRAGTEVERSCLAALRAMDAEVVAESPYLARWLAEGGGR